MAQINPARQRGSMMESLATASSLARWVGMICTCLTLFGIWSDRGIANDASQTPTATHPKPSIGDKIAPLTFKDIRYLPRSLNDFISKQDPVPKRAFVLVFTNTTCPLVQKYLPRLRELDKQYRDRGVQIVAVNVGADDSILDMATQMVKFETEFPFVKDVDGNCVQACGVQRTPEAVLVDADHRLRYRGRIDNQYRLGGTAPSATKSELQDAIDALLAGREIAVAETPVDGCRITPPIAVKPSHKFNYAEHVASIVKQHCQECHQPGTAAPFSLVTYDDVAAHAETMAEVVADRRMPPWYASHEFGTFTNDRTMPKAERETLIDWIRSGMERGESEEGLNADVGASQPSAAAEGCLGKTKSDDDRWADRTWQMGEPDLILDVPGTFKVPAEGYVDYKYAALPQMFWKDTWIQGAEVLPDNPRVVHHANLGYVSIGAKMQNAKLITGYVPGGGPMELRGGVAAKIPAGSIIGLQIHLTTTGRPETVRLRVGFKFPRERVQQELHHLDIHDRRFAIAPFAPAHAVNASRTVERDATVFGFFAHMHNRGRDITFFAHPPRGETQTMLMIPNYSFDWQLPYYLPKSGMKFPGGTRFECVAHYDNSAFNPYNPDPRKTVRNGQQTYEEMMYGYVFYTEDAERLNLEVDPKTGLAVE